MDSCCIDPNGCNGAVTSFRTQVASGENPGPVYSRKMKNAGKLKRDNREPNMEGKVSISTPLNRGRDDGCHETDATTVIMQMC